jgi:hypothetical protein
MAKNREVQDLLRESCQNKPLGQILLEAGLISIGQIELALQEQQKSGLMIGKIIANHGWIEQKTADFFAEKWKPLLQIEEKHPLVYYFQEAALLNPQQIKTLLTIQKQSGQKRFHNLAVEQGYLKQITVDYFLTYLFGFFNPHVVSLEKIYQIIESYFEGKSNFEYSNLPKAPLMNITLQGVKLDNSNLRKANFYQANLSHSSLIEVNLSRADLTQAILTEANFEGAKLTKANLQQSHLELANFQSANLQEADLRDAYLAEACFDFADLRGAKLMSEYPYEVYYNHHTRFDESFAPQQAGWKQQDRA